MKKSTLILLILLIAAGAGAWYFTQKKEADQLHALGWDRNFKVDNVDDIYKIFIVQRSGAKTTLERKGDGWIYNNQFPARQTAVDNIMEIFGTARMQYEPSKTATNVIVESLATIGIKVELFDKNGKKIKGMYVGGSTPQERGTYIILEDAEQPYIAELPMLNGSFRGRLLLTGDEWRDKTVFDYTPEEIDFVSVEYPKQKSKSFKMQRNGGKFDVAPFYDFTQKINKPVQQANVEAFLIGFERQISETFDNKDEENEKYKEIIPFVNITLRTKSGEETQATLYPKGSLGAGGTVKTDEIERFVAYVTKHGNQDWMVTQMRNYRRVLWSYDRFF